VSDPFEPIVIKDSRTYRCVATPEGLDELCALIKDHDVVALDWETTTAARWSPEFEVLGLAIAVSENAGYYIPINHELPSQRRLFQQSPSNIDFDLICRKLGPLLETRVIVCHHAGFDIPVAKQVGLPVSNKIYDTYIAAGVTNDTRERRLGLKELTRNWLGREVTELTDVTEAKNQYNLKWSPIDLVTEYAAADACNTIALHSLTTTKLAQWSAITQIYEKIEMPVVPVIAEMEAQGFLIDQSVLETIHQQAEADCAQYQATMSRLAGYPFDPKKAEHARQMLFDKLCIPVAWKQGKESADRKQLELSFRLLNKKQQKIAQPFFDAYVGHSKADKIRSTYTKALLNRLDHQGRVHPSFLQVATYTGRLSSRSPNFTNLPRDDEQYDIRAAFIPDPDHVFVVADMVQVEFKIAAALSQDSTLVQAANDPSIDVHNNTARVCFEISEDQKVEKQERQDAKCIAGDTRVPVLSRGLVPIQSLIPDREDDTFYKVEPFTVASDTGYRLVDTVYYGGDKDVIELVTKRGRKIVATPRHRLMTSAREWLRLEDAQPGDKLLVSSAGGCFADSYVTLPFNFWARGAQSVIPKNYHGPKVTIDEDWGLVLGAFLGDGTCSARSIALSGDPKDEDHLEKVREAALRCGLAAKSARRESKMRKTLVLQLGSKVLHNFLTYIGVCKNDRRILRVPHVIFISPRSVICTFLSGLFETDGTVSSRALSLTSKSDDFLRDVQLLLQQLGIRSSMSSSRNKVYDRDYYRLGLALEDIDLFRETINFVSVRKKERLSKAVDRPGNRQNKGHLHLVDEVKSVRTLGPQPVFDLSIPPDHSYPAAGLVSHNTLTYAVQYGATAAGLARLLQISTKRAQHIIDGFYNKAYPGLRDWIKAMQELILKRGYSETYYGRRRWADANALQSKDTGLKNSELRKLTNAIAQGTAADLIKLAMRDIQCWLLKEGLQSRMVGQIHDELILHCPLSEASLVLKNVKRLMTSVLLGVTLSVEGDIRSSLSKSNKAVVHLTNTN